MNDLQVREVNDWQSLIHLNHLTPIRVYIVIPHFIDELVELKMGQGTVKWQI